MTKNRTMAINLKQSKLLSNGLRMTIMRLLSDQPRTAKQVADHLQQSPGNIHYHIKMLHESGLLDIVETREIGGIVEKYFQAKATTFLPDFTHSAPEYAKNSTRLTNFFLLTEEEGKKMIEDFQQIIEKWSIKSPNQQGELLEYGIELLFWQKKSEGEGDE